MLDKIECRVMIQFLHLQRKTAEIIHKEMSAICSEKCPSYEIVKQWKFKCSCTSLQDDLTQHSWMAFTCLFWDKEKKKRRGSTITGILKNLQQKLWDIINEKDVVCCQNVYCYQLTMLYQLQLTHEAAEIITFLHKYD